MKNPIREKQEEVFRKLYEEHKGTPMAVSSESWNHKKIRFKKLCELFENDDTFTVHDVGMGLADLYRYMQQQVPDKSFTYSGTEILAAYVEESQALFPECKFYHRDIAEDTFSDHYDYLVMSGVFHQRRDTPIRDWEKFSQHLLKNSFKMCKKGMAFNFISPFVDFYQTQVYYCNMPKLINFINDELSRFFEIRHNYALYEFTVFVYREEYVKSISPEPEFQKYFKVK